MIIEILAMLALLFAGYVAAQALVVVILGGRCKHEAFVGDRYRTCWLREDHKSDHTDGDVCWPR